ncbi:hypothetical protein POTOM_054889 [Populus tomentosa]|uniref:Uncharacterized protein n=1 Tax=Populus tomentosa TaxID=118781 RepID=A0A8X7Y174_POPTO|nr:hypothetical protein POTOM_054889 [Populus tomentosa]
MALPFPNRLLMNLFPVFVIDVMLLAILLMLAIKGPKKRPHAAPTGPDFGSPSEETVAMEKQQPCSATPSIDPMCIRSQSFDRKRSKIAAVVPLGSKKSTTPKLVQLPEDGDPLDVEPPKRFPAIFSFVDVHDSLVGLPLRLVAGLASLCSAALLDIICAAMLFGFVLSVGV